MLDATLVVDRGGFQLDVALRAENGATVALLGPNGAGKSTALELLAGLLGLDAGSITLDSRCLDDPARGVWVPAAARRAGLVFQDHLLFPHLSALDNVAFGLRARGRSKAAARQTAREWLDRVGLADKATSRPATLSGGEAQRVALARALATEPALLLLDEPLAALDASTRVETRRQLRHHLEEFGGATVLVTHDPLDALALASEVVVLANGSVTQAGPISELTARPRSRYVSELVGLNLLLGRAQGTTVALDGGATIVTADELQGDVFVLVHPHAVAVHATEPTGSPRNRWRARIESFELFGGRIRVRTSGAVALVAEITPDSVTSMDLREGQEVWTAVKATEVTAYPR